MVGIKREDYWTGASILCSCRRRAKFGHREMLYLQHFDAFIRAVSGRENKEVEMDKKLNDSIGPMDFPESPFAKYSGTLRLGSQSVDCYVLDDESRVIKRISSSWPSGTISPKNKNRPRYSQYQGRRKRGEWLGSPFTPPFYQGQEDFVNENEAD